MLVNDDVVIESFIFCSRLQECLIARHSVRHSLERVLPSWIRLCNLTHHINFLHYLHLIAHRLVEILPARSIHLKLAPNARLRSHVSSNIKYETSNRQDFPTFGEDESASRVSCGIECYGLSQLV